MNNSKRFLPASWVMFLLILLGYTLYQLPQRQWISSITELLPQSEAWQQQLLGQLNSSRQLSLKLSGLPSAELRHAASQLQEQSASLVSWYQPGSILSELQQQYQQYQSLLVTPQALQQLENGQYLPLITAAWKRLYNPAPLLANALLQDPLLLTQQFLESQSGSKLTVQASWLESPVATDILLLGEVRVDPFDRKPASQLLQQLERQLEALKITWPQLQLDRSGVIFHAVNAADNASFEMQLYGSLSLLAILLLLWFSFRSLRSLWLATLILLPALLCGLAALLLIFDTPHVLCLVFATTLIGLAVDYSFHGMLAANQGRLVFSAMLPSLRLSLLTTLLGYLALFFLPFPLLQQMALFMLAGLVGAFITVWLLLPLLSPPGAMQHNQTVLAACNSLFRLYLRASPKAIWFSLTTLAGLSLTLLLLSGHFNDDVRLFNQSPASLMQQEAAVRTLDNSQWESRFLVILADNSEQALQAGQAITPLLQQWQQQGWLEAWQSINQQLPSARQQQQIQQLLEKAYQHPEVQAYLAQLQLSAPAALTEVLTAEQFSSPMTKQLIRLEQHTASVILLKNVSHPELLQQEVQRIPALYLLDPIADTNQSLLQLRQHLLSWVVLALTLSMTVLFWFRGLRTALATGLILTIATCSALLCSLMVQQHLNVFNLVAAILVLALALDYAVFFTSVLHKPDVIQAVILSAGTSCLAFGLLSFSQTPAVASFGITIFIGVALAAILAPLLAVVCKEETS